MPAGAGGISDVGPASGIPGFSAGGWDIYLGDISAITSFGLPNFDPGWILDRIGGFISTLDIPLGLGAIPFLEPGYGLSALDAPTGYYQDVTDIAPIDRRDESPNEETLVQVVDNWVDYWDLYNAGIPVQHVSQPGAPAVAQTPTILPTDDDMGWISDVYDTVDTALGGWLPGGVPVGASLPGQVFQQAPGAVAPPPVVMQQGMPAMPQLGGPVGACDNDPMKGYVLKKYCGEWRWIKPKRRRRQQLASKSDIKDLTALIGVFGNGKALQAWIATHS